MWIDFFKSFIDLPHILASAWDFASLGKKLRDKMEPLEL